ncbi:MAG: phosphatase PAP2 family protein [Cytophagales bacterium]|nr:phosphatase PAP2 family protein [Cytophagales bacterium]
MNPNKSGLFLFLFAAFLLFGAFLVLFIPKGELILFISDHRHPFMDMFFRYFTHLGNATICLVLFAIFLFVKFVHAIRILILTIVQAVLVYLFKHLWFNNLPRPKVHFNGVAELNFIEGVDIHRYDTFPSGHTVTAFALATLLSMIFYKRMYLSFFLFMAATLVAFSRVYLMQHFFVDVYIGAMLGVLASLITYMLLELYNKQNPGIDKLDGSLVNMKWKW